MRKSHLKTPEIGPETRDNDMTRPCAHPDCDEAGVYPAPKSRLDVRDYIWFCLNHVREYNRNWNYFAGCGIDEMESAIRGSTTWERPSWRFGCARPEFTDPFGFFGHENTGHTTPPPRAPDSDEVRAWEIFALSPCSDAEKVKKRYKELAKQHHPDANGGSRKAEDRLKSINWAYGILKSSNALS